MSFSYIFEVMFQVFIDWGYVIVLLVLEEVVVVVKDKKIKCFICVLNDDFEMFCVFQVQKGGVCYIMFSKCIQVECEIDFIGLVQVILIEDESEYGYFVLEEWQVILDFDEEVVEYFYWFILGW